MVAVFSSLIPTSVVLHGFSIFCTPSFALDCLVITALFSFIQKVLIRSISHKNVLLRTHTKNSLRHFVFCHLAPPLFLMKTMKAFAKHVLPPAKSLPGKLEFPRIAANIITEA